MKLHHVIEGDSDLIFLGLILLVAAVFAAAGFINDYWRKK